jgi:hypothetical protein
MYLLKVLGLFLWHPILVLALGIQGFAGKGAALIVGEPGLETARAFFSFFLFFSAFLDVMGHLL